MPTQVALMSAYWLARFSPDDQNSKYRFELKSRHNLLPTQQDQPKY